VRIERKDKQIDPKTFGGQLRTARQAARLDLLTAGRLAGFKSGDFWNLIEQGKRSPKLTNVPAMAAAVKLNPALLCLAWIREFAEPAHAALVAYFGYDPLDPTGLRDMEPNR
jgi:hypothetical protein